MRRCERQAPASRHTFELSTCSQPLSGVRDDRYVHPENAVEGAGADDLLAALVLIVRIAERRSGAHFEANDNCSEGQTV